MTEEGKEPRSAQGSENEGAPQADVVDAPTVAVHESQPEQGAEVPAEMITPNQAVADDDDGDDETWTNQPKELGDEPIQPDGDEDEDAELEAEPAEEECEVPAPKRQIRDARDVLMYELVARAVQAKTRLRPYLAGAIGVELSNSGEQFLLDWRGEELKVGPAAEKLCIDAPEGASASSKVDCIISLSENNLMAVRSGDLNPQVAMIADKIRVRGKVTPAVYLFNLIAPRSA